MCVSSSAGNRIQELAHVKHTLPVSHTAAGGAFYVTAICLRRKCVSGYFNSVLFHFYVCECTH